jgi:uncharacterized protein
MDDREVVARQLGRRPRAFRRVVVRCPYGRPAVTEQAPYTDDDAPFPTTYWVTCPFLVAEVSQLEAAGGVERWSRAVEEDAELAASLERATAEQRELRRRLAGGAPGAENGTLELGIGGSRSPRNLKCLHAHAAFALARPGYLLGERILGEVGSLWPADGCCSEGLLSGNRG